MDNYKIINQLGDGTFGCVVKAIHKKTGQIVAIKKMKQKYYTWEECVKLPEVAVVRRIHGHPNIVKLREVIREHNQLYFVFEYMDGDLLGVIRKAKQMQNYTVSATGPPIGYPTIKSYAFQILQSLAYLHKRGYFHRDMKPENLLIKKDPTSTPQEVIKLADFGLVKEIRTRPPYTDYVSTRWYRAPELLLQDRAYSSPVDIWAVGCILAELITTRPLFAGSNEVDQLHKIMSVLGSPNEQIWPEGMVLAKKIRYTFPLIKGIGLQRVLPAHIPPQALDLIKQMLTYDPKKRPTAQECLQHPYFNVGLDEGNFASPNVAKQLANAAKKYVSGPQSAPSGNSISTSTCNAKRTLIGASTALPKQVVAVKGSSFSQQEFCASAVADPQTNSEVKGQPLEEQESMVRKKEASTMHPGPLLEKSKSNPPALQKNDGGVDLDGLMDEFAGELKTLGLLPQQKQQTSCSAFNSTSDKKNSPQDTTLGKPPAGSLSTPTVSPTGQDLVTTLLSSTRYKKSSFQGMERGSSMTPHGSVPLQSREPLIHRNSSLGGNGNVSGGGNHAVSPSIKALLAKHREGGFHSIR
ncbi:Protein kinase domain [Trypanosoma melophagium]|uniref:Protein kinase domain n=1 Tax=Trypanosoma melophagium TaxID=715481 RepID=UPI003519E238|nr:Protein kinase domain [Trypanosoma melophagium]